MTESSSVVAWGQGEAAGRRKRDYQGARGTSGCDVYFYNLDCGDNSLRVHTCQNFLKLYNVLHINYISIKLLKII